MGKFIQLILVCFERRFPIVLLLQMICLRVPAHGADSLERFAPRFSTNMIIVRQAAKDNLPTNLWIYRRLPPQPFPREIVSNALAIASLPTMEFSKQSTNDFFIWSPPNPCGVGSCIFSIRPAKAEISYVATNQSLSTDRLPDDETVIKRAFHYASLLGLGNAHLFPKNIFVSSNASGMEGQSTNGFCGKGIVLSRELDGVAFYSNDEADEANGFSIEFGSHGQIRAFSLVWPGLERAEKSRVASSEEMINCLRARKILVLPNPQEEHYFERLKSFSKATSLAITKVIPRYGEGTFGEVPTNDIPPTLLVPFAEVDAIATVGSSNLNIRFLSPILSSEIVRLVGKE